jgi:hypothetical protein
VSRVEKKKISTIMRHVSRVVKVLARGITQTKNTFGLLIGSIGIKTARRFTREGINTAKKIPKKLNNNALPLD